MVRSIKSSLRITSAISHKCQNTNISFSIRHLELKKNTLNGKPQASKSGLDQSKINSTQRMRKHRGNVHVSSEEKGKKREVVRFFSSYWRQQYETNRLKVETFYYAKARCLLKTLTNYTPHTWQPEQHDGLIQKNDQVF